MVLALLSAMILPASHVTVEFRDWNAYPRDYLIILQSGLEYLFMPPARVLGSILTSHVILQIRGEGRKGEIVYFAEDGSFQAVRRGVSSVTSDTMNSPIEFARTQTISVE
jgi:hypothetical protein